MSYTNGLDDPSAYFQTKLYTGNSSTQSITFDGNTNMQPDWVWIKSRSAAEWHQLHDSVRGVAKYFFTNATGGDNERSPNDQITSFNSNGFSLGAASNDSVNTNSATYVAWNWKAGGSASSNSDGSITSTVSANQTAGFSIVSWTGDNSGSATIGHGLGAIPDVVIIKNRTDATNWGVKHSSMTSGHMAVLNGTDPTSDRNGSTNGGIGNLTSSTTFGFIGGSAGVPEVNGSSDSMIAYCFTSIKGFSKHGSYTGNGNADGTFTYLGFKPAFLIIKATSSADNWTMYDNKRPGYNSGNYFLFPNLSNAEDTSNSVWLDFLSNGFKVRATSSTLNTSGNDYIYMAFAENPFVTSTGIPTTAR